MKRFYALLCLMVVAISVYGFTVDGLVYSENKRYGGVHVEGLEDNSYNGQLVIPETVTYDGVTYPVKVIFTNAFRNCTGLTSVIIGDSVTTIFDYAFYGCSNLSSVTFGKSVTEIRSWVFKNCSSLAQFNIPGKINFIGSDTFQNTAWYDNQPDGLIYKDNVLFGYKGEQPEGHLDISNGTKVVAGGAFHDCLLTSVSFPKTIISIGSGAFLQTDIKSLVLPNSLKVLGDRAFAFIYDIKSITSLIKQPFTISNSVFEDIPNTTLLYVPTGTKAKYEATEGWNMFENIEEMEYKPEPYEVKDDQTVAVKNLQPDETGKVEISEKVEIDGVEYTVTEIAEEAFKGNTELTEVIIPGTVTTIGSGAFEGCTNLKAIYVLSPTPASLTTVAAARSAQYKAAGMAVSQFEGINLETCVLYVPFGSEQAYREAEGWKEFKHIVGVHGETDPALTVTANSYSREYGEENPVFEFTTEGATLDGEPVLECEAMAASAVGTYDIVVKKGGVKNYNDTYVNGTLTITKAPLTVTVQDAEREQGVENPQFVLTYSGWKNGETESVLTKMPVATTTTTKDSPAGVYDIVVSGGDAQNYELSYVSGTLTVTVPSGINLTPTLSQGEGAWYDLQGRRIKGRSVKKGVYVVNSRMVVIK